MKRRVRTTVPSLALAAALVLAAGSGSAHHSFAAQYDDTKPITLQGLVTKVEWTNPHTYFYLDVTGESDEVSAWAFEMGSPIVLQRRGWTPRSLSIGDVVEVDGFLARDGSNLVNASSVLKLATGERFYAVNPPEGAR